MNIVGFVQEYFVDPITYGTGYNIYNTITYAILFALVVFGVYKLLRHFNISINNKFIIGVFPFIILGSILRVLQDAEIVDTYLFVTPMVYVTVLVLALVLLVVSIKLEKRLKRAYYKTWAIFGAACCLVALIPFSVANTEGGVLIAVIFVAWAAVLLLIKKYTDKKGIKTLSTENIIILLAHVFDATTTFVSLQYFPQYVEQHVVAGAVIDAIGPIGIYVIKIPVILAVLYMLDKELPTLKVNNERTFIKLAVLILGLGPGLRNALRLIAGV